MTIDRLVVINDASHRIGGASNLSIEAALGVARRGTPVTFIAGDGVPDPDLAAAGVEVIGLGHHRINETARLLAGLRGLYNAPAQRLIGDWIAKHDTPRTAYHVHGWAQILSPSIFASLHAVRHRLMVHAHDYFLACPTGAYAIRSTGARCDRVPMSASCIATRCDLRSQAHKVWRVARTAQLWRYLRVPDHARILAIHAGLVPVLRKAGFASTRICTVPNPVRPFCPVRVEAESNRRFVFVGRLEKPKGPDLACEAAQRAGVPLTVIGDGSMRDQLQQRFPEVEFTGHLPHDRIRSIVVGARALMMTSRDPEPFGLAAAEALWCGLPVVFPPTILLAGDIERSGGGIACDPRDVGAMVDLLRGLAIDDDRVAAMSMGGIKNAHMVGQPFEMWLDQLHQEYATLVRSEWS